MLVSGGGGPTSIFAFLPGLNFSFLSLVIFDASSKESSHLQMSLIFTKLTQVCRVLKVIYFINNLTKKIQ